MLRYLLSEKLSFSQSEIKNALIIITKGTLSSFVFLLTLHQQKTQKIQSFIYPISYSFLCFCYGDL